MFRCLFYLNLVFFYSYPYFKTIISAIHAFFNSKTEEFNILQDNYIASPFLLFIVLFIFSFVYLHRNFFNLSFLKNKK
jgi:hypothetical protein